MSDVPGSAAPVLMTRAQIRNILPHGEAFLFLDSITSLEPGKHITGRMTDITQGEHARLADAHFPGNPLVPGVILMEALAQLGGVAIASIPENAGKLAMLAGIRRWRMRRPVAPGTPILLEAELTHLRGRFGRGELRAYDEQQNLLAEGEMSFALADKTDDLALA